MKPWHKNLKLYKQYSKSLILRSQRGAFSPFMFGVLAGIAIFSGAMRSEYLNELGNLEVARNERLQKEATAMETALENYLLSETQALYTATSGSLSAAEVAQFLATSGATTQSGATLSVRIINYAVAYTIFTGGVNLNGTRNEQIFLMSPTEDDSLKTRIINAATRTDAEALAALPTVVMVDTNRLRQQQVAFSKQKLENMASLLYGYYTRGIVVSGKRLHTFPRNQTEYDTMLTTYNLQPQAKDFWGNNFTYTVDPTGNVTDIETTTTLSERAVLAFITPWNERIPIIANVQ